jgi:hypothetical protein
MSTDDPEIIPPSKNALATRDERGTGATRYDESPPGRLGVIGSRLTGWRAEAEARAYGKIAERIRAQTEVVDAESERRKSAQKLLRITHELEEMPDILADDREQRQHDRSQRAHERAHQRELTTRRRQQELDEADRKITEARTGKFSVEQELENKQRLKQLNLEIWEKRKETEHMESEKIRVLLSREVESLKNPTPKGGEGSLEQLLEMRDLLVKRAVERAADGDASQAEKYEQIVNELDALIVSAQSVVQK